VAIRSIQARFDADVGAPWRAEWCPQQDHPKRGSAASAAAGRTEARRQVDVVLRRTTASSKVIALDPTEKSLEGWLTPARRSPPMVRRRPEDGIAGMERDLRAERLRERSSARQIPSVDGRR